MDDVIDLSKVYRSREALDSQTSMSVARTSPSGNGKLPEGKGHPKGIPIEKLGWTPEMAAKSRLQVASLLEEWEDSRMDVYDED